MGICLGTSSGFRINDKLGQDKVASRFFKMIGLEKYDVNVFYEVYSEIDLRETGRINTADLYYKYRLEKVDFLQRLFSAGINERKDKLVFTDYIAIVWNFLSLDEGLIPSLVYFLYDSDSSDSLDFVEVKTMIEKVHQKSYLTSASVRGMVDLMANSFAQISRAEFCRVCKLNHNICAPLISVQFNLRKLIKGDIFWMKITNKRNTHKEMCRPEFVYDCLRECEEYRAQLARTARIAEFQEMKKKMIGEPKSASQPVSKHDALKQKMSKAKKGEDTVLEETASDNKKPEEKAPSPLLKKSASLKLLAVSAFKDGIKVAPKDEEKSASKVSKWKVLQGNYKKLAAESRDVEKMRKEGSKGKTSGDNCGSTDKTNVVDENIPDDKRKNNSDNEYLRKSSAGGSIKIKRANSGSGKVSDDSEKGKLERSNSKKRLSSVEIGVGKLQRSKSVKMTSRGDFDTPKTLRRVSSCSKFPEDCDKNKVVKLERSHSIKVRRDSDKNSDTVMGVLKRTNSKKLVTDDKDNENKGNGKLKRRKSVNMTSGETVSLAKPRRKTSVYKLFAHSDDNGVTTLEQSTNSKKRIENIDDRADKMKRSNSQFESTDFHKNETDPLTTLPGDIGADSKDNRTVTRNKIKLKPIKLVKKSSMEAQS